MNARFPLLKARTVLFFAVVLVVAGLVPVLYFATLFVWHIAALFQAGSWGPFPATLLHVGLVFALPGLAVVALGVFGVLRQKAVIRVYKQQEEDRLRRARDYRRDSSGADYRDGRREPYIGSGGVGRDADRRAA
jgi:hypothetical protein